MSKIYLVRHGQASFGHNNYDQLTELGRCQADWLGEHLSSVNASISHFFSGELNRQTQTCEIIANRLDRTSRDIRLLSGMNEYCGATLYASFTGGRLAHEHQKTDGKGYWKLFRKAYESWVAGTLNTEHRSWETFCTNIRQALTDVAISTPKGENSLVTTSAGVIGATISLLSGAPSQSAIELSFQTRNTSICEIIASRTGLKLLSFNGIAHLERPERVSSITYV